MARYSDRRIPKPTQDELWRWFCEIVVKLKTAEAVRCFFADVFNRTERLMVVRRLHIAMLLDAGFTYRDIIKAVKSSSPTISRVHRWLEFGRGGYKSAVRTAGRKTPKRMVADIASYYNQR